VAIASICLTYNYDVVIGVTTLCLATSADHLDDEHNEINRNNHF